MSSSPRELSRQTLCPGKFLEFKLIHWQDAQGKPRIWETADRVRDCEAVMIIAWLRPSGQLLLIKQYRPPVKQAVIEFPAGIIDEGETPQQAALRELYEETGYHGRITATLPPAFNTPGLSSEAAHPVLMEIDLNDPQNHNATPHPDDGEDIQVILAPGDNLATFLQSHLDAGDRFDGKVVTYILGLAK